MESIRRFSNAMRYGRRASRSKYTINPPSSITNNMENIKEIKLRLNERCIQKHGYLTKSPSRDRLRNKIARWHLRWILLYDTLPLCDENPSLEREVELIYYKNHEEQNKSDLPIGRINLMGAKIFAQPGGMHGYRYVINIITETRSFHLCATQKIVYDEWLSKLRSHLHHSTSDNDANVYPDDGYATLTKLDKRNLKKEIPPIKYKKLKKYYKSHPEEATSPCQPFQLASKFFQPESETIEVANPPAVIIMDDEELSYGVIEPRRQRSRTIPAVLDDSGDEGISCESASSSLLSNSLSNILSSSTRSCFDSDCGFTGPTFFPCGGMKTLNQQMSRSTGALQYFVNKNNIKDNESMLSTSPGKPKTFSKYSSSTTNKTLRQQYSVGEILSSSRS